MAIEDKKYINNAPIRDDNKFDENFLDKLIKKEIKDHPEQLYKGGIDPFAGVAFYTLPSNKFAIEIASKIPVMCLQELLDNAEKIKEYCKVNI